MKIISLISKDAFKYLVLSEGDILLLKIVLIAFPPGPRKDTTDEGPAIQYV